MSSTSLLLKNCCVSYVLSFTQADLYPWAERHPWQSWRERYKDNSARFNALITTYLEHHSVPESGKGLHGFIRAPPSPLKSQSKQLGAVQSEPPSKELVQELGIVDTAESEWGNHWPIKKGNRSPPPWGKTKRKVDSDNTDGSSNRKKQKYDLS